MSSKRQRDSDDSDDMDYAPNPSDLAAASSVGGVGDEFLEKDAEGVDVTEPPKLKRFKCANYHFKY